MDFSGFFLKKFIRIHFSAIYSHYPLNLFYVLFAFWQKQFRIFFTPWWNHLKPFKSFPNLSEPFKNFKNLSKPCRTLQNLQEPSETLQNRNLIKILPFLKEALQIRNLWHFKKSHQFHWLELLLKVWNQVYCKLLKCQEKSGTKVTCWDQINYLCST